MTLNQLLKEVFALGFTEPEELNEAFLSGANRALKMIFTELAPSLRAEIHVDPNDEKSFDLRERVKSPLIIISAPKHPSGSIINGAYSNGYNITLPESFSGDLYVFYKPMPKELTLDSGEYEIDIPAYAEHLLALLVASFALLDDDPEKADYYAGLYRSEANKLRLMYSLSQDNTYSDVTGWA